jgi:hypothetical protein
VRPSDFGLRFLLPVARRRCATRISHVGYREGAFSKEGRAGRNRPNDDADGELENKGTDGVKLAS